MTYLSTYLVFNSDGSMDAAYYCQLENVYATPMQYIAEAINVDIHDKSKLHYLDDDMNVISVDRRQGMTFNYKTHEWYDATDIADYRARKWTEIKEQRDALEFGGFMWNNNRFDSDSTSQGRLLGAVIAAKAVEWTLADNTVVVLAADAMSAVYAALQQHIASAHERGRVARNKISSAQTVQEIDNIQL